MNLVARISACSSGGAIGGLANSLVVWAAGTLALTTATGVQIAPVLTPAWLYQQIVWGALWGLLFLMPFQISRKRGLSILVRGFLISLGPSLVQLLLILPATGQGRWGLQLGLATPLWVIGFNAIWGWAAAIWVALAEGWKSRRRWFTA